MLLRRLRLRNIRTYEDWEVVLPQGSILFEGGIGSGKSTLLLAIEFALFGLGNERGTTLLSIGKNRGEVELDIEAQGKEVRLHRSLTRSRRSGINQGAIVPGGVKQDECWLEYEGRRWIYSPKEMKEAVLKILNYNEPQDPKAKSVIFRYAVYTPQEEMKEILSQSPDERLRTIRKALRLEEYKTAKENAHELARTLSLKAKFLMDLCKRLPELEKEIGECESKVPVIEEEIRSADGEAFEIEVELRGYRSTNDQLQARLEELSGEARNEAQLRAALTDAARRASQLAEDIALKKEKASSWRAKIQSMGAALPKAIPSSQELEARLREANTKLAEYREAMGKLSQVYQSYASLIEKKICPTCNQRVDTESFRVKCEEARKELEGIRASKAAVEEEAVKLEAELRAARSYEYAANEISTLHDRVYDTEEQILANEKELAIVEGQKVELEEKVKGAAKAASDYRAVRQDFERNREEIRRLEGMLEDLRTRRGIKERELSATKTRLEELSQQKSRIEEDRKRGEALGEYSRWLDGYFSEAMDRIERAILTNANRELDEEFGRWFSFLVDDPTKGVRIDEVFTPLVSQDSYEQEVSNLSGGERTALALAYRLALNKTVQRRAGIEAGLLILDEPTDGFSKDQIAKIGDLLKELDLKQVIIVSHERELEGAVDHIFRVSKEGGRSTVQPVNP